MGTAAQLDVERCLKSSVKALDGADHTYFRKALGLAESWRAFESFRAQAVYLDIETDGGSSGSSVTIVGLYDGKDYQVLRKGENLNDFPDVISQYKMIVTFFGAGFDLPMLQKCFWGLKFDQIHIDLCPTLKRLGYRGGLKKIEKQLGISRGNETDGLSGLDAIYLWRETLKGNEDAYEKLVAYNREDVVNLERLACIAFEQNQARCLRELSQPTA